MATAACERVRAIVNEAKRLAGANGRDPAEIAAELAITNWQPGDRLTVAARKVVADYYEQKGDAATTAAVLNGHRDKMAEVQQARTALANGIGMAVVWLEENQGADARAMLRWATSLAQAAPA